MPSAAARRLYEDHLPTFMSVFDLGAEAIDDRGAVTVVDPNLMGMESPKLPTDTLSQLRPAMLPSDSAHKHNASISTQNFESAESSPTTTLSCTDSSSLSDPSPSSSPDSPVNLPSLSGSKGSFGALPSMATLTVSDALPAQRPMTSPVPRRARNMKGLSIQPPLNSLSNPLVSEPCSPSFIKPKIPAMKRKPSQLSLKTGSSDLIARTTLEVPSSPSVPPMLQRRALKHSTSSPHMLSTLKSATFGPAGGMTIPPVLERNESGLSEFLRPSRPAAPPRSDSTIPEEDSPIRPQMANRAAFEFGPYREHENNEDQKSPGYPDGPIAIYDDNVFLYLEPTAEEASRFDVVINVAREVDNPFSKLAGTKVQIPAKRQATNSPVPDTAVTTASYATAFEFQPEAGTPETPTTPKAHVALRKPEYIHMPWDHNTDIGKDLVMLCETIERKTKQQKKVLVHCQQGASRSASLIIAYGLWQNPELSVNDAYYAAQAKSRWVSPNMKLMYCLQDFQKEVAKMRLHPGANLRSRAGWSSANHRATLSADAIDISKREPLTAPLPDENAGSGEAHIERVPARARGNSTPNRGGPITPGPSSAPSSFSWSEVKDENDPAMFGRFNLDSLVKLSQSSSLSTSRLEPTPLPSTDIQPASIPQLIPPSPGEESPIFSQLRPPPSPGFPPPMMLRLPPQDARSSSFGSQLGPPPPSPGIPPPMILRPPPSPGFAPIGSVSRPPPSPGFGSHRFGTQAGAFGLVPLSLGPPKRQGTKEVVPDPPATIKQGPPDDAALLSPRAETMTNNPLHESLAGFTGIHFGEGPPTPGEGLFSPRQGIFPRDSPFSRPAQSSDPRSPPMKGEMPIVRSIDEMI